MRIITSILFLTLAIVVTAQAESDGPYVVVLGVAQDGGVPQTGTKDHPGWSDAGQSRNVSCLAIVDTGGRVRRWMIDCTPDFPEQLHALDTIAPVPSKPGLDGVFLTHAHMGHYTGLMFLGHESLGANEVPVYAMPRMGEFLRGNGPWSQLVRLKNIAIHTMAPGRPVALSGDISVTPLTVPHRQEYSDVVGFRITGPRRSILFIPDIDQWEDWDALGVRIEDEIAAVDVAYLDGTFYDNGEIPGRDMSSFPHPFIAHSIERFSTLSAAERKKIRFIHLNHTNPALWDHTDARRTIESHGMTVAVEGERVEL